MATICPGQKRLSAVIHIDQGKQRVKENLIFDYALPEIPKPGQRKEYSPGLFPVQKPNNLTNCSNMTRSISPTSFFMMLSASKVE
jgi:hypothetical protein